MQPDKQTGQPNRPRPRPIMDMVPAQPAPRLASQPPQPVKTHISPTAKITKPVTPKQTSKPQPKPASKDKDIERPSAVFILSFVLVLILLAVGAAAGYYFLEYKPAHKSAAAVKTVKDNDNHIIDDTLGIKFAITKDLTAVANAELLKENPYFVYGFKQNDVANVKCTISQQKRTPPGGAVDPVALKDGSLKGIQKSFPDAKLDNYEDTTLVNGQDAASLILHYTDADKAKTATKEKMLVVATKNNVTFAFCSSPQSLFSYYDAKFEPFFNSLEVY